MLRVLIACAPLLLAVACGGSGTADPRPHVLAAAYPFAWAAEQVAGKDARVVSLVKTGGEPHDVELTPRQIGAVEKAALVVYLHGFQPAVDDAVQDSSRSARLDLTSVAQVHRLSSGLVDPHVWMDPVRMSAIVGAIADRLAAADAPHAPAYRSRAARTQAELAALDAQFRSRLSSCARHDIVTSHSAFAYLAGRYGLEQVGVTGLDPDAEPAPSRIAKVARYARAHDVSTVFFEAHGDPKLAQTVASEVGAKTAVLDPIEAVRGSDDYLSVMRRNLVSLTEGLGCR